MISSYQYKLKPTYKQRKLLEIAFNGARYVYNWGLSQKMDVLGDKNKNYSYVELSKKLTSLKKEKPWLYNVPNVCLQQALQDLDSDFTKFYRNKDKFPSYKSKKRNNHISKYNLSVHFDFDKWKVKIPYCKWVKICPNKKFNPIFVEMGTLNVYKDSCGEYWCTILVKDDDYLTPKSPIKEEESVGISFLNKNFITLSDGSVFKIPHQRKYKRKERKICKKFKTNRFLKNLVHNFTAWLMKKRYTTFCIEENAIKNKELWGEIKLQLSYKAEYYLKNLIYVGNLHKNCKNTLLNAQNIKNVALSKQNLVGIDKTIKPK